MKEVSVNGFTALRFGSGEGAKRQAGKVLYVLCFDREGAEKTGKRLAPLCQTICVFKEDGDFSPWEGESLWPEEEWNGGAGDLLRELENSLIPAAEKEWHLNVRSRMLAGYSLAGLCAMYAGYVTEAFDAFACVSGSLWYEGWLDFADAANWLKFTIEDVSSEYDDPAERAKAAESVREEVRKQKAMDDLRFADLPPAVADAAEGDLFCADHRRAHAQQKSAHFVDDAKSPAGRAIELEPEAAQSPMACGLTDSATWRKEKMPLDLSSVPDDGTYRWYRVGAARLRRYGFFYFPANIHCRFDLGFAFVNDDGLPADFNRFDCWLSVARANGRIRVDRLAIRRVPRK